MDNKTGVIEIAAVETKMFETGTQFKIKATDGKSYKFYDKKKDGGFTVAYQQFHDMELKVGSTVEIWYKELEKEYQGKPYTDRLIASFKETNGKPTQKTAPRAEQTYKAEPEPTNWDEVAVGKCQSLFLQAFIQSGHNFSETKLQVGQARKLAELVVYGTQKEISSNSKDSGANEPLPEPPPEDNDPF